MNETSTDTDVCEVFLAINEAGDWVVGTDYDSCAEEMTNEYGAAMCRMAAIRVYINRPKMAHGEVHVPDELTKVATTVVAASE